MSILSLRRVNVNSAVTLFFTGVGKNIIIYRTFVVLFFYGQLFDENIVKKFLIRILEKKIM